MNCYPFKATDTTTASGILTAGVLAQMVVSSVSLKGFTSIVAYLTVLLQAPG